MASKKGTSNIRGKKPTPLTVAMLCAKSAGRCEFEGCNKYVLHDSLTKKELNESNIAHIVAANPNGPRGHELRSYELSDKITNLMLMCPEHHKLIDALVDDYPEERLLKMKKKHEDRVSELCNYMYAKPSEVVRLLSPIKNCAVTQIDIETAAIAMLPDKRPASDYGITIEIKSEKEYNSREYWNDVEQAITNIFRKKILNAVDADSDVHFSVFPLAPIPLIIKLGYLFMDKTGVDIYQKSRQHDTWKWQEKKPTNTFSMEKKILGKGNKVALVMSLTAEIDYDRIKSVYKADIVYTIRAKRQGVDSIKSIEDLSAFWHMYQEICDEIKNADRINEFSVFPAIPVSAAFEVGRRYMPKVYPKIHIYDDNNGFIETLTIGKE